MIRAPDPARAQRAIIQDRLRRILGAALFAAIYAWVLFPVARFYWFVPAGWRFAALAVLPWRHVQIGEVQNCNGPGCGIENRHSLSTHGEPVAFHERTPRKRSESGGAKASNY